MIYVPLQVLDKLGIRIVGNDDLSCAVYGAYETRKSCPGAQLQYRLVTDE